MTPRAGEFDERHPPLIEGGRPILAVRMSNTGVVFYDMDALAHFDVVMRLNLDPHLVADGGWIIDGHWDPGHSKRYSSKNPVEIKRINIECDSMRKYNETSD